MITLPFWSHLFHLLSSTSPPTRQDLLLAHHQGPHLPPPSFSSSFCICCQNSALCRVFPSHLCTRAHSHSSHTRILALGGLTLLGHSFLLLNNTYHILPSPGMSMDVLSPHLAYQTRKPAQSFSLGSSFLSTDCLESCS